MIICLFVCHKSSQSEYHEHVVSIIHSFGRSIVFNSLAHTSHGLDLIFVMGNIILNIIQAISQLFDLFLSPYHEKSDNIKAEEIVFNPNASYAYSLLQ